ncbi:hypothetical protein [Morganella psychrotolerans]|uniref:hypothetical protein n=1 Tax=Morganella psychrotolerans TaxID=368603 RepID=UPI0039B078EC
MAHFLSFMPFVMPSAGTLLSPALKPAARIPGTVTATTAEVRLFLSVMRNGKTPLLSEKLPQPTVPKKSPAFLLPTHVLSDIKQSGNTTSKAKTVPDTAGNTGKKEHESQNKTARSGFSKIPDKQELRLIQNITAQCIARRDTTEKTHHHRDNITDIPADTAFPADTTRVTTHLHIKQADVITRISETLVTRISHISRSTETLSTCNATFPALGEINFTIRSRPDGLHIHIQCPTGGQAFLQSCLPQLQERLAQKIPQPVTITLTGNTSGSPASVRRK